MHALGRRVRLRQRVVSTACVYFLRFFQAHTLLDHDPLLVAPTALWVASKVEESPVSPKLLLREVADLALRGNVYELAQMLAAEYVLLDALLPHGLAVEHPHGSLAALLAEADLLIAVPLQKANEARPFLRGCEAAHDERLCAAGQLLAERCGGELAPRLVK